MARSKAVTGCAVVTTCLWRNIRSAPEGPRGPDQSPLTRAQPPGAAGGRLRGPAAGGRLRGLKAGAGCAPGRAALMPAARRAMAASNDDGRGDGRPSVAGRCAGRTIQRRSGPDHGRHGPPAAVWCVERTQGATARAQARRTAVRDGRPVPDGSARRPTRAGRRRTAANPGPVAPDDGRPERGRARYTRRVNAPQEAQPRWRSRTCD